MNEETQAKLAKYTEQEIQDMQEIAKRRWVPFEAILDEFERADEQ